MRQLIWSLCSSPSLAAATLVGYKRVKHEYSEYCGLVEASNPLQTIFIYYIFWDCVINIDSKYTYSWKSWVPNRNKRAETHLIGISRQWHLSVCSARPSAVSCSQLMKRRTCVFPLAVWSSSNQKRFQVSPESAANSHVSTLQLLSRSTATCLLIIHQAAEGEYWELHLPDMHVSEVLRI